MSNGERTTDSITIYNQGDASVNDTIKFAYKSSKNKPQKVLVSGFSEYIKKDNLFLNSSKDISVISYEIESPNGSDMFRLFLGQKITIETGGYKQDSKTYTGVLKEFNNTRIMLTDGTKSVVINNPTVKSVSINSDDRDEYSMFSLLKYVGSGGSKEMIDVINPYLYATVKDNAPNVSSGDKTLNISYTTSNITYKISYLLTLFEQKQNMDINIKYTIFNRTSSTFRNARITLIEKSLENESSKSKNKYYYQKARSAPAVNQMNVTNNFDDDDDDVNQNQKSFPMKDRLSIEKNSELSVNMLTFSEIEAELQYIYQPQVNKFITMDLVWQNRKLGIVLPHGTATVQKIDNGIRSALGTSSINQNNSTKEVVRMNLGTDSSIFGKFSEISRSTSTTESIYSVQYQITITNVSKVERKIIVKQTFDKTSYQVNGDITFTQIEPDNDGELISNRVGQAILFAEPSKENVFTYTVTYKK